MWIKSDGMISNIDKYTFIYIGSDYWISSDTGIGIAKCKDRQEAEYILDRIFYSLSVGDKSFDLGMAVCEYNKLNYKKKQMEEKK